MKKSVAIRDTFLLALWVGFEPTTDRLTADCSAAELPEHGNQHHYHN